jgi:hypothetical protein
MPEGCVQETSRHATERIAENKTHVQDLRPWNTTGPKIPLPVLTDLSNLDEIRAGSHHHGRPGFLHAGENPVAMKWDRGHPVHDQHKFPLSWPFQLFSVFFLVPGINI